MDILKKYAKLLVDYCVSLKPGEKLYIKSTTLAEPLVKEVYRYALSKGGIVEYDLDFQGKNKIFYQEANNAALNSLPTLNQKAMESFDAYIVIRAPFNLMEDQHLDKEKIAARRKAMQPLNTLYFERTATKALKRSLCQYPTIASAQMARMSLEEYQEFVFNACYLYDENPAEQWKKVGKQQQKLVDFLNPVNNIRYVNKHSDISFSVEGRTWINSDGKTNMPSGEVFSAPVENSVNGTIYFNYPSVYAGYAVEGIELTVKDGKVIKGTAKKGQELLDKILKTEGANYFGEVAIGTNYQIQTPTQNILFDEKIGGTIHMALGQSYKHCGGKNNSAIHWDMIADMKDGGKIFADEVLIYKDGHFII